MKKLFRLTHKKIKPARLFENVRADVNKNLKRERAQKLPDGFHYWDFDCRIGASDEDAKPSHVGDLKAAIDQAEKDGAEMLFVEITPVAKVRAAREVKPDPEADADPAAE